MSAPIYDVVNNEFVGVVELLAESDFNHGR